MFKYGSCLTVHAQKYGSCTIWFMFKKHSLKKSHFTNTEIIVTYFLSASFRSKIHFSVLNNPYSLANLAFN